MPDYAEDCRTKYEGTTRNTTDKYTFVECVYLGAVRNARDEQLVERGTKALIELTQLSNRGQFIHRERIGSHAMMASSQSASSGLWPWIDGDGRAGVIEKQRNAYRIKDEFIEAMLQLYQNHLK